MSAQQTNVMHILDKVDTSVLLKAARERNAQMRAAFGRYASLKRLVDCPVCTAKLGVRELRRHRKKGCKCLHCKKTVGGKSGDVRRHLATCAKKKAA